MTWQSCPKIQGFQSTSELSGGSKEAFLTSTWIWRRLLGLPSEPPWFWWAPNPPPKKKCTPFVSSDFLRSFSLRPCNVDDHEICISERWGWSGRSRKGQNKNYPFWKWIPSKDKNSTSQEGLENACNLYDGAAMLAEGRVSRKAVGWFWWIPHNQP